MKGGTNLRLLQSERAEKEEKEWVKPQPCLICGTVMPGAYAHHGYGWTCSNACMRKEDAKPKYQGHTEEDFFNRQGDHHDTSVLSRQVA